MGEEERASFNQLKLSLSSSPVLKLFDQKSATEVHCDASMYRYGAVLLQKDSADQEFHPVEYMSRKTTDAEEKYPSYELEVLAIVQALKKWRIYLLGRKIKIVTDCNAFAMTMRKNDVPVKVSRWAMFLQDFEYIIEHRPGTKMKHVDALSRVHILLLQESVRHRIQQAQRQDEWIKAICKVLETHTYDDFYLKHEVLHKNPIKELIVIPSAMENEIINTAHRQGHFGIKRTIDLVLAIITFQI